VISQKLAQTVGELAHEIFGAVPAEVKEISLGVMTYKFAVELPNGERYVVRFYPRSRASVVEYEPDLLRRCSDVGLGTPQVVIDSRTGPWAEMNYVVYQMIEGMPLAHKLSSLSSEGLRQIARDIIHRLQGLAQLSVLGYGDLVAADRARFDSLSDFFARSFAQGLKTAEESQLWPREMIEKLWSIARKIGTRVQENRVGLTWGDLSVENILIDPNNGVAGLVDFEGVIAANPLLNLGYAYARYYPSAFFDALARAWQAPLNKSQWHSIHFYCVLRAVRLAQFAAEPLPTGHSRTTIEDLLPGFRPAITALFDE
jgi:aminoglycoside phosphotransferase (APT) family kinase protein